MDIRLSRPTGPLLVVLGAGIFGAVLAGAGTQLPSVLDRPACAERVMKAVASDHPVAGTYACFDNHLQSGLQTLGIDSDGTFATRVGQTGEYQFLHKTADGGYVYEYDRLTAKHDRLRGAMTDLGMPRIAADIERFDFGAAWGETNDFGAAWAEITGQTQKPHSTLFTFYMDRGGKVTSVQ